jgi:cobalt-zinc-cadmium efflux system outer membrane protein
MIHMRIGCFLALLALTLQGAIAQEASTTARLTAASFHAPDGQIRELIDILLTENPQLSAAWTRSQSSFERVPQERALPDPLLTYRYFAKTPETRVGPQEHMLEWSQGVPWVGKLSLQADRAESLASGKTWEAGDLERRLVALLKRLYFEASYLQESLAVNAEERELLLRFESIALRRYATGQGIQQSVVKVQTDISRLADRETDLRERLDALLRRVAEVIGRSEHPVILQQIILRMPDVSHERSVMEGWAVEDHPRVQAVQRRIEADRIWAKRRKLDAKPDFRLGLGYGIVNDRDDPAGIASPPADNGQDVMALTVGIKVPIYRQRIRAGVAEARESGRANEELLQAVRDGLRYDVQEALLRLDSLSERGRLFLDVIIPQAEESLASAEAAYTTDRLGFLDLLDAERILFQSRLTYHRLVADIWIALADLEQAIARPFPNSPSGAAQPSGAQTGSAL